MKKIRWWFKLGWLFFTMNIRSTISYYRWSFVGVYIAHVLGYVNSYIIIWASMRSFKGLLGWNMRDVVFIYSIDLLSYALANMFVQPFWRMNELVGQGKLDDYLVRPVHSLIHIMLRHIEFGYLAHISVAITAMGVVITLSGIAWTIHNIIALVVTLIGAFFLQCTFGILPSCSTFFTIQSDQLAGMIRWGGREFIKYPIIIYPAGIRYLISFIIPFAFVNYYPVLSLLDKAKGIWVYGPLMSLGLGIFLFSITVVVWNWSIKHYSSSC